MGCLHPRLLLVVAVAVAGCGNPADVVVTSTATAPGDGGQYIHDVRVVPRCAAGYYGGRFRTLSGPLAFEGDVQFTLVARPGGEFRTVTGDSDLRGSTLDGAQISANVVADGVCRSGAFAAQLENGEFSSQGLTIPFEGAVQGSYVDDAEAPAFHGSWTATYLGGAESAGEWYAGRRPSP